MKIDSDFAAQLSGKGVLTTEILYYRPDYRSLLQTFVWQTMDVAPRYPRLAQFLDHWRRCCPYRRPQIDSPNWLIGRGQSTDR